MTMGLTVEDPKLDKEVKADWDFAKGYHRYGTPSGFWTALLNNTSIEFVKANRETLEEIHTAAIEKRALSMYKANINIYYVYGYTHELHQRLLAEHEDDNTVAIKVDTNRYGQDSIYVTRTTSLQKLTEKFNWSRPEIDAGKVRFMIRRVLTDVLKRPAVKEITFYGETIRKHDTGLTSPYAVAMKNLPYRFRTILDAKLKRYQFRLDHPWISCFQDVVYDLYRKVGDDVLQYCQKAYEAGQIENQKILAENEEEKARAEREGRYFHPKALRDVLHDALYAFPGMIRMLTPAAARQLLQKHPATVTNFLNEVNSFFSLLEGSRDSRRRKVLTEKEKCRMIKAFLKEKMPIQAIRDQREAIVNAQQTDELKKLNVSPAIVEPFMERMRVYAGLSALDVIRTFGHSLARKIFKGTHEGIFAPLEIPLPPSFLATDIRRALGRMGDGAAVSNPKRLFHKLSKIGDGDVREMAHGRIADPLAVIKALTEMGYEVPHLHEQALNLRAVVESKCSPEFLVAGNASVCCMSFGAENARTYATQKGFGVLNLYLGDRIIANSVLWINELEVGKALVLDNVEVHPNYVRFNEYLISLYQLIMQRLMRDYDCIVTAQGQSFNDLKLEEIDHPIRQFPWEKHPIGVNSSHFYTDADNVKFVATLQTADEAAKWASEMPAEMKKAPKKAIHVETAFAMAAGF